MVISEISYCIACVCSLKTRNILGDIPFDDARTPKVDHKITKVCDDVIDDDVVILRLLAGTVSPVSLLQYTDHLSFPIIIFPL